MTPQLEENATLLAATEVVPADWRDLAVILEDNGGPGVLLPSSASNDDRDSALLRFVRAAIDPVRVRHWRSVLEALFSRYPDVRMLTVDSPDYPRTLKKAYGRPPFIFVKGTLDQRDRQCVAIVGSRSTSSENLLLAKSIAGELANAGITVVSGLALGADSAAHAGALDAGGRTIAVVAAGIDQSFKRDGDNLAHRICQNGALISQFRPGAPPARSSFLQRNGVISGLSAVSVIIEASERSGTRNELEHALQQDRRVLLWESSFVTQKWARAYINNDRVHMVQSIEDILARVRDAVGELQACE